MDNSNRAMQVIVDSLLTSYYEIGRGRVVVLLHGWGDSAAGLKVLQKALAEKYRVVALDLPGFGGTQAPNGVWGLSEYSSFLENFLRKIGIKNVHAVIGHSNSGAIAIRGLAEGSLHTDKLVLMAASGIRGTYKGRVKALRAITKVGKALSSPLPKGVKRHLRRKVYDTVGSDMLVAGHLQETFKKIVADDVRADAAKLSLPTLLLYGEQDKATPPWYGEAYHELITGSTLEILPGAGHFVHQDRPNEVTSAIEDFLS